MHESQLHQFSSFVTLTYADAHIPYGGVLHYRHFQLFMRKLRRRVPGVRFFMCGEYGEALNRPHYHAALFGAAFADRYPWRTSAAGFQLYRSPSLESLWDLGSAEIGDLSFESAAYIARYCLKKHVGKGKEAHYEKLVLDSGEVIQATPEFMRASCKPHGIGYDWFTKFKSDCIPRDAVVMDGGEVPIPRYYLEMLTEDERSEYVMRRYAASKGGIDSRPDRLRVREIVALAGMSFKSNRNLQGY